MNRSPSSSTFLTAFLLSAIVALSLVVGWPISRAEIAKIEFARAAGVWRAAGEQAASERVSPLGSGGDDARTRSGGPVGAAGNRTSVAGGERGYFACGRVP